VKRNQLVGKAGVATFLLGFCVNGSLAATARQATAAAGAPVTLLRNDKVEVVRHAGARCDASAKATRVIVTRAGAVRSLTPGESTSCGSGDVEIILRQKPTGHVASSPLNPWHIDPRHYQIVLENAAVRVIRVRMGPREGAPPHEHSLDRVVIYMTDQDFRITPEQKDPERVTHRAGGVGWGTPLRHVEENLADRSFEAIVVELK